jgi:hypothetical protein
VNGAETNTSGLVINGRLAVGLIILALATGLSGVTGVVSMYVKLQSVDQRVETLESRVVGAEAVKTQVAGLVSDFRYFRDSYNERHGTLLAKIEELARNIREHRVKE